VCLAAFRFGCKDSESREQKTNLFDFLPGGILSDVKSVKTERKKTIFLSMK
jgi:hypothetical protein